MAFNIRKVPMPGTAEADVSALFGKLAGWLAGDGRLARDDEQARIGYVVKALSGIQNKLYEEREARDALTADFPGDDPGAPTLALPDPWGEKRPDEAPTPAVVQATDDAITAGASLPYAPGEREALVLEAVYALCAACGRSPATSGTGQCAPCASGVPAVIQTTWSDVMTGDEVYSDVDGRWWEVVESPADSGNGMATIANAEVINADGTHGRTFPFRPPMDAVIKVRRGNIRKAVEILADAGLNLGSVEL